MPVSGCSESWLTDCHRGDHCSACPAHNTLPFPHGPLQPLAASGLSEPARATVNGIAAYSYLAHIFGVLHNHCHWGADSDVLGAIPHQDLGQHPVILCLPLHCCLQDGEVLSGIIRVVHKTSCTASACCTPWTPLQGVGPKSVLVLAFGSTCTCVAWPVLHPTASIELATSADGSLHEIGMQRMLVTGLCPACMLWSLPTLLTAAGHEQRSAMAESCAARV